MGSRVTRLADLIFTNEQTNMTNSAGVRDVGSVNSRVLH